MTRTPRVLRNEDFERPYHFGLHSLYNYRTYYHKIPQFTSQIPLEIFRHDQQSFLGLFFFFSPFIPFLLSSDKLYIFIPFPLDLTHNHSPHASKQAKSLFKNPSKNPQKQAKSLYKKNKKVPSKTLKSNPVMESHISSSRKSHLWTLGDTRRAILLLGEEGNIAGGYFLDDIHPVFFNVGGSCGLSSGPVDFLGMIGGKTTWTSEDGLDLEYDCDLVGLGGLDHDLYHVLDDDQDDTVDAVDFLGLNNILGLNPTKSGCNFVLTNGEDYVSGFVQFMGKGRPTLKFMKGLEMFFTNLLFGLPKVKPMKLKIFGLSGESGPVSILKPFSEISLASRGTKIRLKALSVPRPIVSLEGIRIPVLLSYSPRDGDLELYVPSFNARVVRPPLAVNFSRYVMVSHNYRDCEILLLNKHTREIIVYRGLDNTVVNLPNLQDFRRSCFRVSGRFQKVVLGGGQSDYRVFVIAFHRRLLPIVDDDDDHHQLGTQVRLYYRQPNQQDWSRTEYIVTDFIQRPRAFFVIQEFFVWVDVRSGTLFSIEDWDIDPAAGVPFPGPTMIAQLVFEGAHCVFSVEDGEKLCLVVHHYDAFSVFDLSIVKLFVLGLGHQAVYDMARRVSLSERNFYCSLFNVGFSAAPPPFGAGPINAIFVGGYQGDCSRLNNYAEIVDQQDAGLLMVDVDFECLRHCHDPLIAARPLVCRCQSAFLLLPVHLVARMIPDLAPFLR